MVKIVPNDLTVQNFVLFEKFGSRIDGPILLRLSNTRSMFLDYVLAKFITRLRNNDYPETLCTQAYYSNTENGAD